MENKPEWTGVPSSTAFLPLLNPALPPHAAELTALAGGSKDPAGSAWEQSAGPTSRASVPLHNRVTLHGGRDFEDIIKVTNQLTLNSSKWRLQLCGGASANHVRRLKSVSSQPVAEENTMSLQGGGSPLLKWTEPWGKARVILWELRAVPGQHPTRSKDLALTTTRV